METIELTTLEQCAEYIGTTLEKAIPQAFHDVATEDEIGYREVKLVTSAYNKKHNEGNDFVVDWSNMDQWKYQAWLKIHADKENPSGSAVSYYVYVDVYSVSFVGSRLCWVSDNAAKEAINAHSESFAKFMLR